MSEAACLGILDGVTTNPTLIMKEGKDFVKEIKEIISIFKKNKIDDFTVSAEVTKTDSAKEMIAQGKKLAKIDKHVLVKVPLTREGLKAVKSLSQDKIKCNVTLCFSANQALLAAKAGAWCVSPFLGRLDDTGENGLHLVHEIRTIFDNYDMDCKILAASIRSAEHVKNCAMIGSDIITVPLKVYKKMFEHNLTDVGLEKFKKDWEEYLHKI
ncbi:MAG: fructose-6-phosphate aldolase [Nanoarchaeota archaeon]|nr:fructose-6-phosphate aldolase [Nanoarchaeota archaeon]